jgi:hypothetical protein
MGMVYADEKHSGSPKVGQEFRDRQRCDALQSCGYDVFTLDDKHASNEGVATRHCKSNFCDERRMSKWFRTVFAGQGQESCAWYGDYKVDRNTWGGRLDFDLIVLDYFFSPNSWTKVRWAETLFTKVLPAWATNGMLRPGGVMWMPHVAHVDEMLALHGAMLARWFAIERVEDPMQNPLFEASARPECEKQLLRCQEIIHNGNQLPYLMAHSSTPFVRLTLRARAELAAPLSKKRKLAL